MSREYSECVYNLWTGFVGKATCEAGYLNCDGLSCSMYTPKKDAKPTTHFDWIKSLSVEELANVLTDDWCEILCGSPSVCDGQCEGKMLSWLKTPLNKEGTR